MSGDTQLNLGSTGWAAPDFEASADSVRSLAHARESPMIVLSGAQHLWLDATAVVVYVHSQLFGPIFNLDLDVVCLRVAERVHQGLATDPVNIVADKRMQWA